MSDLVEKICAEYTASKVANQLIVYYEGQHELAAERSDGVWEVTPRWKALLGAMAESPKKTTRKKRATRVAQPVQPSETSGDAA